MTQSPARLALPALRALAVELAERVCERVCAVPLPGELASELAALGLPELRRRAVVTWETRAGASRIFGFGEALRLRGERGAPIADARHVVAELRDAVNVPVVPGRPRIFAGFAFDPANRHHDPTWDTFGGYQLLLPRILLEQDGEEWTGSAVVVPGDPSGADEFEAVLERALCPAPAPAAETEPRDRGLAPGAWQLAVAEAVRRIRCGAYEKVVLARSVDVPRHAPKEGVLGALAERYPTTFVFSFTAGDATWLGASPERLVALSDGVVRVASLAGSRPRGETPAHDEQLARELFESAKERAEHAVVVEAVRQALEPACDELTVPGEPQLMRMANIQHLYTPVTGHVREGVDVLDLVERIHPTPAVGGWPRCDALAAIRELEGMDRGWYAAPIGWLDFAGDGEFAVALRSALLTGGRAVLYAGAGIVEGSDPAEELAETELKLRPLRGALEQA